jgi:hypothetical protein
MEVFQPNTSYQFIISPIPRLYEKRAYYTFLFLIEEFLLEYFVRAIPFKRSQEKGVHKKSPTLFVPHKSIFDVPELVNLLTSAFNKVRVDTVIRVKPSDAASGQTAART